VIEAQRYVSASRVQLPEIDLDVQFINSILDELKLSLSVRPAHGGNNQRAIHLEYCRLSLFEGFERDCCGRLQSVRIGQQFGSDLITGDVNRCLLGLSEGLWDEDARGDQGEAR